MRKRRRERRYDSLETTHDRTDDLPQQQQPPPRWFPPGFPPTRGRSVLGDRPGAERGEHAQCRQVPGRSMRSGGERAAGACAVGERPAGAGGRMRRAAGGLEMEPERSEVIATTPPRPCCMEEEGEEDVSQASSPGSGTHVSSVSGFSLGEAIVQRAKQGTELWSQLHSGPDTDTGELTSATAARVLAAGPEFSQTLDELPTMEEGTITFTEQLSPSSESGQFQSPQMFEMQDSALSPALALVTACSTQHLHSDLSQSFFHRSPLEFAPLRAAPDLSVVSQEGGPGSFQANNLLQLLISEVSADCVRGSLSLSRDGSEAFLLSQHPLSPEDDHFTHADSYLRDQRFMELPSRPAGGHITSRGGADPQLGPPLGREGVEEEPQNQTEVEKPSGAGQSGGCPGTGAVPEGDGQRAADLQGCGTEDGESSGPLWNPEASDGTVPLQGQPVDRTDSHWDQPVDGTVQLQGQPVDGMVPLQGQPVDGTVPLQGQPLDGTVPHWCQPVDRTDSHWGQPVDRTDSHWGQPVDGTVPHWGQPVDGMVQLQGQPVDRTDSHWGQPVDGTVPLQGQPAVKTSPVSGRVASSQPLSEGSLMCSNGQAVGPGPGSGRVTSGTGSPTPDSSKNDTAIEVLPGRGDVGSGAGQEDGLSPAPVPAQPDHRSTPESAVENAPSAPGPARRGAGHQRVPLAPVFAGQDPTAGGASQPPPSHVKEGGACSPGRGQKGWPTFDSLVLHGLRGVAPRQQAYLAVADSLNRMLARANRGAEGRESPERASPCTPSPHPPDRHTAPLGSSSDRGHSPALLSPPDSTPSDRQGPETGGRGWSSSLTPPSPYQLTAHQLDTTSTDDGLLPPGSSLDTSRAAEHTLTMSSHSLTSLEVDNYVPAWAPSTLTPEPNHFCIDDRIQVYLRNLGISQSPSSILASQGPDREAEFNHAELRELSEEALQEYQGEEGVSALDRDSGSAFYSNVLTHSVSIGLGSVADSNSPDHTHPWLGIEEDRGVEAADSRCHSGYAPDPRASSPLPAHDLSLTGDSLDENRAPPPPDSAAAHRSGGFFPGLGAPGLSPAGRGAVTEPPLPSEGGSTLRHRGDDPYRRSDSFVGSDTLSEIRKLLGEAAHISAWRPDPRSPAPDRLRSAFPASFQWDGSETDPETDRARHPGGSFWLLPASRAGPEGATLTSLSSKPGPDPAEPPPPTSQPFPQPGGAWAAASGTKPNKSMDGSSRTDLSSDQLTSRTRDQSPVRLTRSRSPATSEMDPRAQGWERTKVSRWPLDALSILDEEDRRKIDEIKAELLQNSKTSTSPQETWWARAEDSSLKSDPSSSADPVWPAHPLATLPSLGTARLQPQRPAGGAMDRLGELVPGLSTCQLARPIAAITFSSRRKPSPTTPQPSSTSPTAPQPSSLQPSAPQPSSASYSAPLPSSARSSTPLPTSLPPSAPLPTPPPMEASSSPGPAHSPEAVLGGEKGRWPWGDPWLVGKSCSPLRSPTRTVVSHVRVTLSPNRPDTLGTPPSPLRTSRLTDTDVQWSGPDPGRQPSPTPPHPTPILPPHPSAPAAAHTGPPYPPLPMPVPAFCPSLPLLFERPSVAPTPEAGQTPGRDGAGQRLPAVKGGSKVDVSTQTSGLGQSPPPSAQGQAQGHDSTEETPSGTAPRTTGTTSVSGQAGNTDVPLMLPYKPAGSSELFYVASAGTRRGIGRGDSESSSDVYRPGSLEIVPEATRRHTRDVGVTFPSPDSDVSLHRGGRPRERTDPWSGDTGRGSKLGNRTSKRHPAVAWYIPAVELQEDWRKENVPERRQRWGRAWGRQEEAPRCWREPLRQRQLQEAWTSEEEGRWGPGKTLSSLIPLSLGDALSMKRPWFISHSRERVRRLALLKEERKFQSDLQSERDRLFNQPPARGHPHRGPQPDDPVLYKKRISRQEMWDRSKRLYEQLPEVTRQKEEAKRRSESRSNRLRAQLYKQKITNRVLGRKVSWQ
ncbi:uncharacterized protein LOC144598289 [Rhinoraja longicauda]